MSSVHPVVKIMRLSRQLYKDSLVLQKNVVNNVKENDLDGVVLLLEHQPVFTIGIRSKDYNKEVEEKLLNTGAEFFRTNRGGLITFHGPGQLVAYPILNLKHFNLNMKNYICLLEDVIINMCKVSFNLEANRSPHTGVWIKDNKVCAIGVHGSRYITSHGLALNCDIDLNWFDHIVPCGIPDKGVTSLSKELFYNVSVDDTIPYFVDSFKNVFNCNVFFKSE